MPSPEALAMSKSPARQAAWRGVVLVGGMASES